MPGSASHFALYSNRRDALVRGSSRRIMIMRFRPANIRLINRRQNMPQLRLALFSKKRQKQPQRQKQPYRCAGVDRVTPYQSGSPIHVPSPALCKVAFS